MNFELDDEQTMLRDSVRLWVEKNYGFSKHKEIRGTPEGFSRAYWRDMAELGWLGVSLPEQSGGLGQSLLDACIIAEELGRGLVLEPFESVSIFAAHLIAQAGSPEQGSAWLAPLIAGKSIIAVAHSEQEARGDLSYVETRAVPAAGGWRLTGKKSLVFAGGAADLLVVSARTSGECDEKSGLSLFAVDPRSTGLLPRNYRTVDGRQATDFTFDGVTVPAARLLGARDAAIAPLEYAYQRALIVLCAEALGMMEQALWLTREYLRTRMQFGVVIGTFQALQHRAADMYVEVQVARAALWRALALLSEDDAASRRAVDSAKAQIGRAARFVCGQAIQLHGGIALTEEFPIGHYFKRMTTFDLTYGSASSHVRNVAQAL